MVVGPVVVGDPSRRTTFVCVPDADVALSHLLRDISLPYLTLNQRWILAGEKPEESDGKVGFQGAERGRRLPRIMA